MLCKEMDFFGIREAKYKKHALIVSALRKDRAI